MTEEEWLTCTTPRSMVRFLGNRVSKRKLRLFTAACCRQIAHLFPNEGCRQVIEQVERYADRQIPRRELTEARKRLHEASKALFTSRTCAGMAVSAAAVATAHAASVPVNDFAVCVFAEFASHLGSFPPDTPILDTLPGPNGATSRTEGAMHCHLLRDIFGHPFRRVAIPRAVCRYNNGIIGRLAHLIYDERAFERLPILADALEEAGCDEGAILEHLRGGDEHVRGCWVLDLLRAEY